MSTREPIPDDVPGATGMPASVYPAAQMDAGRFHDALANLLAFQTEQQHVLRQFFDLQALLAGGSTPRRTPAPLALPPAAPGRLEHPLPDGGERVAMPLGAVPPPRSAVPPPARIGKPAPVPELPELPAQAIRPAPTPVPASAPAAAMPAPPKAAAGTGPVAAPASAAAFSAELLQAVSERTGYPVDMLDMDAHMEADLGIDSIKRIEIFSNLSQRHSLVGERDEEKLIEELSGFKTLREVVTWYETLLRPEAATPAAEVSPKKAPAPLSPRDEEVEPQDMAQQDMARQDTPAHADPVLSYVVQASSAPPGTAAAVAWPAALPILLVGEVSTLAAALRATLEEQGYRVHHIVPGPFTRAVDAAHTELDLSSPDTVAPLEQLLRLQETPPGALVNLMGHGQAATRDHRSDARALFMLLKVIGPALRRGAALGAGRLVNLTAFDGRFGLGGASRGAVGSAGTLGVAKSAAREWADLRVKCIDAAPDLDPAVLAAQIAREMFGSDPDVEVGLAADGRYRIDLVPRRIERGALGECALAPGAVVLVTGGAYGITASLAGMLADKYRPRLVLVGRSPLPGEEDAATRGVTEVASLRQLLTAQLQAAQQKVTPAAVEAALRRLRKEREMRANLAAFQASAGAVEYHCLDVRDGPAFGALIDDVYRRLGRIDGVIHGAGVISDKLILSKPVAAFDTVFDTKVLPALTLAAKLDFARLRFIVFLSSVAGRFGNIGQADYSAANEVLNKLAGQLSHTWPDLHALAINWGPWDAGMVNDDLRRLYAARSIRPIPATTGQRHFLDELEHGPRRQPEIVISSSIGQIAALQLTS